MSHDSQLTSTPAAAGEPAEAPAPAASAPQAVSRLRGEILHEATRLFAERGYAGASMRELAEAAHCTKPALYYHFENKAALFLAAIKEQTGRLTALIAPQLSLPGSVRERLCLSMHAYLAHVRAEPHMMALLLRADLHPDNDQPEFDFQSLRMLYFGMLRELLQQGIDAGEIRSDLQLDDAVIALIGVVDQRCLLWLVERQPIPIDYPERILALLFGGLAP